MSNDILNMAAAVASTGPNMNESVRGGGGPREVPKEGFTKLRFVGYVETGLHEKEVTVAGKKVKKDQQQVWLTFELSGVNHPPREHEGKKIPILKTIVLNLSLNEKARFYKLFLKMNCDGKATHMSQLLGNAFTARVVHSKVGEGADAKTYWDLENDDGFTIGAPRIVTDDPETGETITKPVTVDPAITPLRLFVWNAQPEFLKKMWDSLFIDGEYGEGDKKRSANILQNEIKKAKNFEGSPIDAVLQSGGATPDIPAESGVKVPARSADPLDNVA